MANLSTRAATPFSVVAHLVTIAAMFGFTLLMAVLLLGGKIGAQQGYLWMGICCLFPIGWYSYGYLRSRENLQTGGLLVTLIGWVFIAIGFLVHYKTLIERDPGASLVSVSLTPLIVLLLLGLFILIAGGLISWRAISSAGPSEDLL